MTTEQVRELREEHLMYEADTPQSVNRDVVALCDSWLLQQKVVDEAPYVLECWLPTLECNGPRDCCGTTQGCSHCSSDAGVERFREAVAAALSPAAFPDEGEMTT